MSNNSNQPPTTGILPAPGGLPTPPKPTSIFASQELATNQQIFSLLNILNQLTSTLRVDPEDPTDAKLDGGLSSAAVATGIAVCDRLDKILADDARWSVNQAANVEQAVIAVNEAQALQFRERAVTLADMRRPSSRYRPSVVRIQQFFIAFSGDLQTPGAAIIGRGDTPEKALRDYDDAFLRTPEEQLRVILDSLPGNQEQPEAPPTPTPKPERKKRK